MTAALVSNAHDRAMTIALIEHESRFAAAVARELRALARQAHARFLRHQQTLTAAADDPLRIPLEQELANAKASQAAIEKIVEKYRTRASHDAIDSMGADLGVSFDVRNRILDGVIKGQSGAKISTAPEELVREMMTSLQESYDTGASIPKAARAMRATGYTHAKGYGERVARTELLRGVNSASLALVHATGAAKFKIWMATMDRRTRPHHRAANGQTVSVKESFSVGGSRLQYPGDPNAPADEVILCRCALGYSDEAEIGISDESSRSAPRSTGDTISTVQDAVDTVMRQVVPNRKVDYEIVEIGDEDLATARSLPGKKIAVHRESSHKTNINAVTHEMGHLIDRSVLGTEDEWFTSSAAGDELFQMMKETRTIRAIRNDEIKVLEGDTQTRNYFLQGREMFARAFHQHAAMVSGNPELMAEIRHLQADDFLSFQVWQDDEFAPISAKLRELFEAVTASAARLSTNSGGASMATAVETEEGVAVGASWSGPIVQEGVNTGDGRRIAEGALSWRELPLTLMSQHNTPGMGGHADAEVAGRIDTLERNGNNIDGAGIFDTGEWGAETQRLVSDGMLKGISVDLSVEEYEIIPAEGVEDPDEAMWLGTLNILKGTILGATIVPFPAFENATIAITASARQDLRKVDGVLTASFYMPFAPFPPGDDADPAPADGGEDNSDAADAIADITDAVKSWPGLDGKVIITIDGEDTTVSFPAESDDEEDAAVTAALATIREALRAKVSA